MPPKSDRTLQKFDPSSNHWTLRYFKERVTRAQLRYHLLNNADPIIGGELWQWKSKHVGAGIYELFVVPRD